MSATRISAEVQSDSDDDIISEVSWDKLQNTCHSQGYREGLMEGKERKLQEGFDQGYLSGFKASQNLAEIKGFLSALMLNRTTDPGLSEKLKTIIADM